MSKVIAIDLDETIAETLDGVLEFHDYHIKDIPIIRSEVTNYQLRNIPKYKKSGIVQSDGIKLFNDYIESTDNYSCKSVSGAKEKIQEWKNKGYSIKILTGRAESQRELSIKRLEKEFPNMFDDIIFANYFTAKEKSKGEICKEMGATIMIEDNLEYSEKIAEEGILVYLLKKPRNIQYDNSNPMIIHVDSRNDINL